MVRNELAPFGLDTRRAKERGFVGERTSTNAMDREPAYTTRVRSLRLQTSPPRVGPRHALVSHVSDLQEWCQQGASSFRLHNVDRDGGWLPWGINSGTKIKGKAAEPPSAELGVEQEVSALLLPGSRSGSAF
jgi:hypothetical protein